MEPGRRDGKPIIVVRERFSLLFHGTCEVLIHDHQRDEYKASGKFQHEQNPWIVLLGELIERSIY
jgi:hypothetical protein